MRNLAVQVASAPKAHVKGDFFRHKSWKAPNGLQGSQAGGRWGPPGLYSVLYVGQPTASVIVEAYRHLVDDVEGMTPDLVARRKFLTCRVDVSNVLDLRTKEAQQMVGLSADDLGSHVGNYEACQEVGRKAHQLELHGVIAPAATGLGETLALFTQHLPQSEWPAVVSEDIWEKLPDDPRRLRIVNGFN